MPLVRPMNKREIKAEYKRRKKELKYEYKGEKKRRKYAYRIRKEELRYQKKTASDEARRGVKKALRAEKREYKKEAYLQKSIYMEKRGNLKKKKREQLGSLVQIVAEHAPESLAGSLTLSYMLIFLIFALLQGMFVIAAAYYIVDRRATDSVLTVAATLEASELRQDVAERLAEESALNIAVYREDGTLVYAYGLSGLEESLPYNEKWEEPFSHRHQTELLRIYSKKTEMGAEPVWLNIAKSMKTETALLSVIVNLLLVSVVLALGVSYFVGYRTTRKLLRPIGVLGRAMEEMSASRLSDRLETDNIRTELVEVVESYNHMLDKIEDAYERQKQFVSDASHELRTPLAVISGYADILSRWGGEDPAVRQEAVNAIVSQAAGMQKLLERLLYIARSENGRVRPELAQVELSGLCGEVLQDFRMMYPDRDFQLSGQASAWCDSNLVRQILTILLDNSVKFTAAGGQIQLNLSEEGETAAFSVADNGVGMTEEVAAHAFERFYKGDSSHNEKGFGLGLSIAKILAEAMGGGIGVVSAPQEGSTFTVTLPKTGTEPGKSS